MHPPTGKLLVLCCGRAKEALLFDEAGDPRPRRSDEPWQDTLRCVDPVTGARAQQLLCALPRRFITWQQERMSWFAGLAAHCADLWGCCNCCAPRAAHRPLKPLLHSTAALSGPEHMLVECGAYDLLTPVKCPALSGQCVAEYGMAKGEAATGLCLLTMPSRVQGAMDAAAQASRCIV